MDYLPQNNLPSIYQNDIVDSTARELESYNMVYQAAKMPKIPIKGAMAASAIAGGAIAGITKQTEKGSISGNINAYSLGKAYIRIVRKLQYMPEEYKGVGSTQGYPSNEYVLLNDCEGFTRVKSINLSISGATQNELNEIERLLKEGVLL